MESMGTMVDFIKLYGTEKACLKTLIAQRWADGFLCPHCGCRNGYWLKKRRSFECTECGYQASVTAGTVFHGTRTSIQKWLIAIHLMTSSPKAPSATELERQLGVTHKTAWAIRQKIMCAMTRRDGELMLRGIVELDESFVGGRERGTRGRQTERKTLVAVAVDHTTPGGCRHAHLQVIPNAGEQALAAMAQATIVPDSTILTDGWPSYRNLGVKGYRHQPFVLETSQDASKLLPWVHIVISNFKRWILDIFHGISPKHLQGYLDEFCYRLNRRWNRSDLFRRVLNRCLLFTAPVTYNQLIAP
jgi:transposase-like protein